MTITLVFAHTYPQVVALQQPVLLLSPNGRFHSTPEPGVNGLRKVSGAYVWRVHAWRVRACSHWCP